MLSSSERRKIIDLINCEVVPAIGCTEPIAVALCTARGLVQGDPQGRFRPQSDLTRAQIAAILSRMAE